MDVLLSHYNLDSIVPTFFELYAEEKLTPAVMAAFRYFFTLLAQRSPRLHPLIKNLDEVFLLVWGALDRRMLSSYDSTFTENFFAMKRVKVLSTSSSESGTAQGAELERDAAANIDEPPLTFAHAPLDDADRWFSLVTKLGLVYARQRLESYVKTHLEMVAYDDIAERDRAEASQPWRRTVRVGVTTVYPYVHALYEALTLAYYVAYVLERTPYFTPLLHLRRIALKRVTAQDAAQGGNFATRVKLLMMCLVIAYKLLDWWHNSAASASGADAEGSAARKAAVRRPPPQAPLVASLPETPGTCPMCRRSLVNPGLNAASGYVFCYPCIRPHVETHGRCPVTGVETLPEHIRRLYESPS